MTVGHILRVPTHVHDAGPLDTRWCFRCRARVDFTWTLHAPDDPRSYYGPHTTVECARGHVDGDCFPGTTREPPDDP